MKCDKNTCSLVRSDGQRHGSESKAFTWQVESALKGGATCVQLREKELNDDEFLKLSRSARCAEKYSVPFFVNDNVDVAMECRRRRSRPPGGYGRQARCARR